MSDKEIASNFFTIKNVKELKDSFYKVTLENNYVLTEDINIILAFFSKPEIGQKVLLKMELC